MPTDTVRKHLVAALEADIVGPFDPHPEGQEECLPLTPSRWYMAGFIVPEKGREVGGAAAEGDLSALEEGEELGAGAEAGDLADQETSSPEPEVHRRRFYPASMGMSVALPAAARGTALKVSISWADYSPETQAGDGGGSRHWRRQPHRPVEVSVPLHEETFRGGIAIPAPQGLEAGLSGLYLDGEIREGRTAAGGELYLAMTIFVVNRREPADSRREEDSRFAFQVKMTVAHPLGFLPRGRLTEQAAQEMDDRIASLHHRDTHEYAVGHGVSVAPTPVQGPVNQVETSYLPQAEVKHTLPHEERDVELSMEALAALPDGEAVAAALGRLPLAYGKWIDDQAKAALDTDEQRAVQQTLVKRARQTQARIGAGLLLLQAHAEARRCFCLANAAMASAARARSGSSSPAQPAPRWRLFQLAFVLMNLAALVDPETEDPGEPHKLDRERVDLLFFSTGGGKTEAYLGLVAFLLLWRRVEGSGRPDGGLGVAVILRYTLRLLTLDQFSRAASLICGLELLRRKQPERLGKRRFSVGLWVGRAATANTIDEVKKDIDHYKASNLADDTSPCPLLKCPWCQTPFSRDSLSAQPTFKQAEWVRVGCLNADCDFYNHKAKDGLPVVFVDEQIYDELPALIIATVDKFAMLPWRGENGMLFGRVRGLLQDKFVGPMSSKQSLDHHLPQGLRPPDLILQDELHLISGPLGTMMGLYEMAVEELCCRKTLQGIIRPKIIAATATVRRADQQIQKLFARGESAVFPPPGINADDSYFARLDADRPGRLYLGVCAPGKSLKNTMVKTYITLLSAAAKNYVKADGAAAAADAYMTLVGYFNSLRELGGMRRLVEDTVRQQLGRRLERLPRDVARHLWAGKRQPLRSAVELTSRIPMGAVARTRTDLSLPWSEKSSIDVLLASNMISVGIDIDRLGLMVLAGQPKTSSEYIQASSRVGRNVAWPGLVVTCFNAHRPRDRSHYEHFVGYHRHFYSQVEAAGLTPFSGPALDRGLAGALLAMMRLGDPEMTRADSVMQVGHHPATAEAVLAAIERRVDIVNQGQASDELGAARLSDTVRKRAHGLLDIWRQRVAEFKQNNSDLTYSQFDRPKHKVNLMYLPKDLHAQVDGSAFTAFAAPTSMRDVEPVSHVWISSDFLGGKNNA